MSDGFAAFARRARSGSGMVPVTRQVVLDGDTPVTAFAKLHRGPYGFLLESLEGGERWARYTFLATDPREVFRYRGRECSRWTSTTGWEVVERDVAPLEHLGRTLRRHPAVEVPGLPRFTGGAVGYLGYDIVRTIEDLPDAPPDDRELPDAVLMVTHTLLVLDNLYNRATVIANVEVPAEAGDALLRRLFDAAEATIDVWLGRLAEPGTTRPLALVDKTPASRGELAIRGREFPGGCPPDQGVHRRGRYVSDRALPPARGGVTRPVSHVSLPPSPQSRAVPVPSCIATIPTSLGAHPRS